MLVERRERHQGGPPVAIPPPNEPPPPPPNVANNLNPIVNDIIPIGGQPVAVPPPNEPPPPPPNVANNLNPVVNNIIAMNAFGWMTDAHICVMHHRFTGCMIRTLSCGYCNSALTSLEYLRQHLEGAHHNVFACCGRFFGREQDFNLHRMAQRSAHAHMVRRTV